MTIKNARDMTPEEWRRAREAISQQHALNQRQQLEKAALKELERKYPKIEVKSK